MASAEFEIRLLDMPEVQRLFQMLRVLALAHCDGCDDEAGHRQVEMAADGFRQEFIDGTGDLKWS